MGERVQGAQDSRIQVFVLQGFDHCFEHSLDFPALYICKQSLCDICLTFTLLKLFHLNPGLLEPLDPGSSPTDWEKNQKLLMVEIKKEDYTAITMETLCFAIIGSNVYINVEEQIAYYVGRESKTLSGQKKEPLKVS